MEACQRLSPRSAGQLRQAILASQYPDFIPRGLGRSYGDAAVNSTGAVIDLRQQDCLLELDPAAGTISCESGSSLERIATTTLPRGWFLPVTPGTRHVTVGGAIAADVHGKNSHRDGTFGHYVLGIDLLTSDGQVRRCSATENPQLFAATLGGMGLTGIILNAKIQLSRIATAYCQVTYQRTRDLEQTLSLLAEAESRHRYGVAWIDGLQSGSSLGRAVLMSGHDAQIDQLPPGLRHHPLWQPSRPTRLWPAWVPAGMMNRTTLSAFNGAYYHHHRNGVRIVSFDQFFYPLDRAAQWNRLYGPRGFIQYQALFPHATAPKAIQELLETIHGRRHLVTLGVLKSTARPGPGLLSFVIPGITLALDLPMTGQPTLELVNELDQILLRYQGRLYLAKDALMSAETFAATYPRLAEFQAIKNEYDPQQRFSSSLARRLRITERT
ncbi:MAG: FAD-binding oxidoreductase [Pirellulales bacterium]